MQVIFVPAEVFVKKGTPFWLIPRHHPMLNANIFLLCFVLRSCSGIAEHPALLHTIWKLSERDKGRTKKRVSIRVLNYFRRPGAVSWLKAMDDPSGNNHGRVKRIPNTITDVNQFNWLCLFLDLKLKCNTAEYEVFTSASFIRLKCILLKQHQ